MKTIVLVLLLITGHVLYATTYYVSASGSDEANGTSRATPWKSLAKVSFTDFRPGDHILFRRGDVFTGKLLVRQSGSDHNPIVYAAYGTGAWPVITGLVQVNGWKTLGGGIFQAVIDRKTASALNLVTMNDVPQALGRYPNVNAANGGFLKIDAHEELNSITGSSLPESYNFSGGEVVIKKHNFIIDRGPIRSQRGHTIQFSGTTPRYPVQNGWGYFIQSHPSTLDQPGEWYFDRTTSTLKMYFGKNDPQKYSVKASVTDTVINLNRKNYITFDSLRITGGNLFNVVMDVTKGLTIKNCEISLSGGDAVKGNDAIFDFTFTNNTVAHSLNEGINLYGCSNGKISSNAILNSGVLPGMGRNGDGTYSAMNVILCNNMLIQNNRIINTGYIGIAMYGYLITVKNNFVNYFNLVMQDGGGIYVSGYNLGTGDDQHGKVIAGNIVMNGYGQNAGTPNPLHSDGIYVDDNNSGVLITENTVADGNGNGIFIHNAHEISILKNTVYNTDVSVYWSHGNDAPTQMIVNNIFKGNILFCKTSAQYFHDLRSFRNDLADFGVIDSNFYCRPEGSKALFVAGYTSPSMEVRDYNLIQWKSAFPGRDKHSVHNPAGNFEPGMARFEFNATGSSVNVPLPGNYLDVKGKIYRGNIELSPYSSAVLIKASKVAGQGRSSPKSVR